MPKSRSGGRKSNKNLIEPELSLHLMEGFGPSLGLGGLNYSRKLQLIYPNRLLLTISMEHFKKRWVLREVCWKYIKGSWKKIYSESQIKATTLSLQRFIKEGVTTSSEKLLGYFSVRWSLKV